VALKQMQPSAPWLHLACAQVSLLGSRFFRARAFAIASRVRELRMAVFHLSRNEPWRQEEAKWFFDCLAPLVAEG